jgi:hypothetical protein
MTSVDALVVLVFLDSAVRMEEPRIMSNMRGRLRGRYISAGNASATGEDERAVELSVNCDADRPECAVLSRD